MDSEITEKEYRLSLDGSSGESGKLLNTNWDEIIYQVSLRDNSTAEWLKDGLPDTFGNDRVAIVYTNPVSLDTIKKEKHMELVEKIIGKVLGNINIKVIPILDKQASHIFTHWLGEKLFDDDSNEASSNDKSSDAKGQQYKKVDKPDRSKRENNQGSYVSKGFPMYEMSDGVMFRSQAEVKLYQPFKKSEVLFFPLPLGIVGKEFKNKKEPDYLVCKKGVWGILEIVDDHTHASVERDAERIRWFQNHKVPIRPYSYRQCMEEPEVVVADFLNWLEKPF